MHTFDMLIKDLIFIGVVAVVITIVTFAFSKYLDWKSNKKKG